VPCNYLHTSKSLTVNFYCFIRAEVFTLYANIITPKHMRILPVDGKYRPTNLTQRVLRVL